MGELRISGVVADSIVDGPGLRTTVFVQGCHLRCLGCHNPATWPIDGGRLVPVHELLDELASYPLISGLTISGGEPTLQAGPCAELAAGAHELGLNVWCYTGYQLASLRRRARNEPGLAAFLSEVDVLVDGPYLQAKRTLNLEWRGSTNQQIHYLRLVPQLQSSTESAGSVG